MMNSTPASPKGSRLTRASGEAARFIQTSLKEWAYSQAYDSTAEREDCLKPCFFSTTKGRAAP